MGVELKQPLLLEMVRFEKHSPYRVPSTREKIFEMNRLPLLRLFVACGMGMLFLAGSFNPNFLRANIAPWNPFVHMFIALFGAAWFIQAAFIHRQISEQRR
jgi:hypothetical protein